VDEGIVTHEETRSIFQLPFVGKTKLTKGQDDRFNPFVDDLSQNPNLTEEKKKVLISLMAYYKAG
jgi:hypothetical protein